MLALANKYRPQSFKEVVGQENVIKILSNQVANGDFSRAYLFTGGAGTGKTTSARILARAVNGSAKNIIEIDGASNNGVDNVRDLIEVAKFKPLDSPFKVFIIDEVHMLSTGAFNALLKILEEPPAHVIFILATTDPQKIPATVLSRLQRFDFKRLTSEQIYDQLKNIVDWENAEIADHYPESEGMNEYIQVADDALDYISKLAQGGMRSGISLLDTCLSYNTVLAVQDITQILGVSSHSDFIDMLESIVEADRSEILRILQDQHDSGKDLKVFTKGFLEFIVEIIKIEISRNLSGSMIPSVFHEDLKVVLNKAATFDLFNLYEKLADLHNLIKYETSPKFMIEGGFVTIC